MGWSARPESTIIIRKFFNGDGVKDILLGASGGDGPAEARSSAGEAYVVFGRAVFPSSLSLEVQGPGGADVTLWGPSTNDQFASSSFITGDFDGDGIADIIVGASGGDGPAEARSGAGEAFIVRGRAAFPATLDTGSGGADLTIYGATASDSLTSGGSLVLGDVNRDGVPDLLLGAALADGPAETRSSAGEAYLLFGGPMDLASVDLSVQGDGGADVTIYGATGGDNLAPGRKLWPAVSLRMPNKMCGTQSSHSVKNKHRALTLELTLDGGVLTGALVDPSLNTAAVNAWFRTSNPSVYAAPYAFSLMQTNLDPALPQGTGHGSFTVSPATGSLLIAGAVPDNSTFTGSTFVGPQGQVVIYQSLYGGTGSFAGTLLITPDATAAANQISGTPTWYAAPLTIKSGKAAVSLPGFGPIPLSATGGALSDP
ncbi:MAG TPA: VCBS repeat-containing protein [Prosthecobacter sp.]|nr:VCBS repeat-containing protein [Prosthecobacter sp.]